MDDIVRSLRNDGKKRLQEAKKKNLNDETDTDELLTAVAGAEVLTMILPENMF